MPAPASIILSLLTLVTLSGVSDAAPIRHSFFVAGPTFTGIIDEAGKPVWDSGRARARDPQH